MKTAITIILSLAIFASTASAYCSGGAKERYDCIFREEAQRRRDTDARERERKAEDHRRKADARHRKEDRNRGW